jgi:hypothetical protein
MVPQSKRKATDATSPTTNEHVDGSVVATTNNAVRQRRFVAVAISTVGADVFRERSTCETSVLRHHTKAVTTDCTTYDVSGMGRKLPLVLLDFLLKKIDQRGGGAKLPEDIPLYNVVPGDGLLLLKQPTQLLVERDIMNVLAEMIYDRIIEKRHIIEVPAESNHSQILNGLRKLNGNRYELHMKPGRKNGNGAMVMIVNSIVNDIMLENEQTLVDCAAKQAAAAAAATGNPVKLVVEPTNLRRLHNYPYSYQHDAYKVINCLTQHANYHAMNSGVTSGDFVYENHAIIVTFADVYPQDPHVDLDDLSSYQFGFVLSEQSLPTHHYKPGPGASYLEPDQPLNSIWTDTTDDLSSTLRGIDDCQSLLTKFGKVLTLPRVSIGPQCTLSRGSIIALPAREVHGGPASTEGRAIMFFTGRPIFETISYDDDVQYCCTALISDLLVHSWIRLTYDQRREMLSKWVTLGIKKDRFGLLHITHRHLLVMGKALRVCPKRRLDVLLDTIANDTRWETLPAGTWMSEDYSYII